MNTENVVESAFNMLMSQNFADWYTEQFIPFVEGDEAAPTKTEIMQYLEKRLIKN